MDECKQRTWLALARETLGKVAVCCVLLQDKDAKPGEQNVGDMAQGQCKELVSPLCQDMQ